MPLKKYNAVVFWRPGRHGPATYRNVTSPANLARYCEGYCSGVHHINLYDPAKPKGKNFVKQYKTTI